MGVDFALACNDCKEFVDCHKWVPHEEAGKVLVAHFYPEYGVPVSRYVVSSIDGCPVIYVDAPDLLRGISRQAPEHEYIQQLKECLPDFVHTHQRHKIFIACDLGPELWKWDVPPEIWTKWKEVQGFWLYRSFLPRHLAEDRKLKSWDEARAVLRVEHDWLLHEQADEDLMAIRGAFEKLVGE